MNMATLEAKTDATTEANFDVDEAIELADKITTNLKNARKMFGKRQFERLQSAWKQVAIDFVREVSPRIENGKVSALDKIRLRVSLIELEFLLTDGEN